MRRFLLIPTLFLSVSTIVGFAARAEKAVLIECVKQYKSLGISPDAALRECQKNTLSECVKKLVGMNYVAMSVRKAPKGYLIDLGRDQSRWLEGQPWRYHGCEPNVNGPKKSVKELVRGITWDGTRRKAWFRQGWCQTESIELTHPYGVEDAKIRCELGVPIPAKKI